MDEQCAFCLEVGRAYTYQRGLLNWVYYICDKHKQPGMLSLLSAQRQPYWIVPGVVAWARPSHIDAIREEAMFYNAALGQPYAGDASGSE